MPYSRNQIVVLLACVGVFALGQFHRASGGVFTPILMDYYAVSAATIGSLVSAMFFATILAQVPFGIVLDRIGPRLVLTGCILLIAVGTVLFALNVTYEMTFFSRVLLGIGMAAMGAATHVIIARNFDPNDFGYVSGLVITLGGIGGLLGTYPLALSLERFSWELVFGFAAVVAVLLSVLVFLAIKPGSGASEQADKAENADGYFYLLRQAEFLKILALGTVTFAPIVTISGLWGGPYLQDVVGFSAEGAGAVLLMVFVCTTVAGYTFGLLDKRASSRFWLVISTVSVSGLCLIVLSLLDRPGAFVSVGLILAMVFFQQFYIPLGAHMRRTVPDHMLGRASTLLSLISVAAIPVMQIGFGMILDMTSSLGFAQEDQYRFGFAAMGVLILIAGLIYSTTKEADGRPTSR